MGRVVVVDCTASQLRWNRFLTEKSQILKRWDEHFKNALNRPPAISDVAVDWLSQMEINVELALLSSLLETIRTMQQLSSGKAPVSHAIPRELYKHGGHRLMDQLTKLFQEIWRCGQVPQDSKDATILHVYKLKGN
nr:unnamed protein product [Spirometra erinaceieuropaei]